jgi:hypothetical protein
LWSDAALASLAYQGTALLNAGFAVRPLTSAETQYGLHRAVLLPTNAPALLIWAHIMGIRAGDALSLSLRAPDGHLVTERTFELPRNRAHHMAYTGTKIPEGGWPAGVYTGHLRLSRTVDGERHTPIDVTRQLEVRAPAPAPAEEPATE